MNAKTMEGLVGARTNINLLNSPMRVFRAAERRGDTEAMNRAMKYAGDFSDRAEDYQAKAEKGMEEDAREAREKAKWQREEAIRKRQEEQGKLEARLEEGGNTDAGETASCCLEISGEGRACQEAGANSRGTDPDGGNAAAGSVPVIKTAAGTPTAYTRTGEAAPAKPGAQVSVRV